MEQPTRSCIRTVHRTVHTQRGLGKGARHANRRLTVGAREGTLEAIDQVVERLSAPVWLGLTAIAVVGSAAGTLWAVGAADVFLGGFALVSGASGVGAAVRSRAIGRLPLELAPLAAVRSGFDGEPSITVRGWLGRGRRVDAISADVALEGAEDVELHVWVPPTPLVGRFQLVVTGLPEDHAVRSLRVVVRATGADGEQVAARSYASDDRQDGRFAPGLQLGPQVRWARAEWARVEPLEAP